MRPRIAPLCGMMLGLGVAAAFAGPTPQTAPSGPATNGAIVCKVLEVHTDEQEGVTLVLFHQGEKSEGPRLGALLRGHDGARVEFETSAGHPQPATLFRIGACFGRGLLVFRAGSAQLSKGEQFWLRFPQER